MKETGTIWERKKFEIVEALDNELLSHAYGWDPDIIEELDPRIKRNYLAILQGRADAGG